MQNPTLSAKPRYALLDGLRGVAALMVIWYHIFEGFATSPIDQKFNHGYLAVDFFFVLSGFVIGYAYDDRWNRGMTTKEFILRRIIRLHPMLVIAAIIGAISFLLQGSVQWDGTAIPLSAVVCATILSIFMIPSLPGTTTEVRGNGEMFPINGPSWSLFFEYIASFAYALLLRRLSTNALKSIVAVSGIGIAVYLLTNLSGAYHLGVGWSAGEFGFIGGLLRVSFSFGVGLLMSRGFNPIKIRGAFWICSALMIAIFCTPYVGGEQHPILNGVFDAVCTICIFPIVVYMGASGFTSDSFSTGICDFFGRISYPIYIIHYPAMYLFYSWVWNNNLTFSQVWPVAVCIFFGSILCAWLFLKYYDEPVRAALTKIIFRRNQNK